MTASVTLLVTQLFYELICPHSCFDQKREFVNWETDEWHFIKGLEGKLTSAYYP